MIKKIYCNIKMKFSDFPLYPVIITSVLWIAFSQLNELKNAGDPNNGCCKDSSCGKSGWDKFIWVIVLIMSIISTLHLVWKSGGKELYNRNKKPAAVSAFGRKGFPAADSGNVFGQRYGRAGFNRTVFGAPIM
jgi:hypothetical protein